MLVRRDDKMLMIIERVTLLSAAGTGSAHCISRVQIGALIGFLAAAHDRVESPIIAVEATVDVSMADDLDDTSDCRVIAAAPRPLGPAFVTRIETFAHRLICWGYGGLASDKIVFRQPQVILDAIVGGDLHMKLPSPDNDDGLMENFA